MRLLATPDGASAPLLFQLHKGLASKLARWLWDSPRGIQPPPPDQGGVG